MRSAISPALTDSTNGVPGAVVQGRPKGGCFRKRVMARREMRRVTSTFVSSRRDKAMGWGRSPPHLYTNYEQLVEIILIDSTSRCACMPRAPSRVPVAPAVAPAVVVGSGEAAVVPAPAGDAADDVWFIDES